MELSGAEISLGSDREHPKQPVLGRHRQSCAVILRSEWLLHVTLISKILSFFSPWFSFCARKFTNCVKQIGWMPGDCKSNCAIPSVKSVNFGYSSNFLEVAHYLGMFGFILAVGFELHE